MRTAAILPASGIDSPAPVIRAGEIPSSATQPADRIPVLDLLRGFAILGMILVNFNDDTKEGTGAGAVMHGLIELLVSGKAHTTFALLFGVGFALQLRRARAMNRPFVAGFVRRLAMLTVFGFIAEVGFGMNVLIGYAIWALPLLLVSELTLRRLVLLAVVCLASRQIFEMTMGLHAWATLGVDGATAADAARRIPYQTRWDMLQLAEGSGSYLQAIQARIAYMPWFYTRPWFVTPVGLGIFLLGMIALRAGIIETPRKHARAIALIAIAGAILWAADNWLLPLPWPDIPVRRVAGPIHRILGLIEDRWLALTYIGGGLLLAAYSPALMQRLTLVQSAGRMALTNYLVQVIVIDLTGAAYGLSLALNPLIVPVATIALFATLALASHWWLARFRFGPAEWLLRSATYAKVPTLTR